MNNVTLLGRITKELELKVYGETKVVNFSLAVNRKFKKNEADFIMCKAFNKTAEIMSQYLNKGSQIAVEGRIQTGSYEKEGKRVYTTDVIVGSFYFAEGSKKAADETSQADDFAPVSEDELPF